MCQSFKFIDEFYAKIRCIHYFHPAIILTFRIFRKVPKFHSEQAQIIIIVTLVFYQNSLYITTVLWFTSTLGLKYQSRSLFYPMLLYTTCGKGLMQNSIIIFLKLTAFWDFWNILAQQQKIVSACHVAKNVLFINLVFCKDP